MTVKVERTAHGGRTTPSPEEPADPPLTRDPCGTGTQHRGWHATPVTDYEYGRAWAQEVERHGRRIKLFRAVAVFVGACLVFAWAGIEASLHTAGFWTSSVAVAMGLVLVFLLLVLFVRWRASKEFENILERQPSIAGRERDRTPTPPLAGRIIVCSGGGIKSASFCLGGLQALNDAKLYTSSRSVVGVSGGGYMAAAFAVLRGREAAKRAAPGDAASTRLDIPTDWVEDFRRLTNYLASSGRVRYDLVASWLLGVVVNCLILLVAMGTVGWIAMELGLASGLIAEGSGGSFDLNPAPSRSWWLVFLLPIVLCCLGFAGFVILRWVRKTSFAANSTTDRGWRADPELGQIKKRREGEWRQWRANIPSGLSAVGLVYAVVVLLVPIVAVDMQGDSVLNWVQVKVIGLVAGPIAYVMSIRSSFKGLAPSVPTTLPSQVLAFVRTKLSPLIALILYLGAVFLAAAVVDRFLLTQDWTRHNLWVWLAFVAGVLAIRIIGTANQTSMYTFYRDRLRAAYLSGGPAPAEKTQEAAESRAMTLQWLERIKGEPKLVLCATANLRDQELLPTGRDGSSFVFGDRVGLTDVFLPGGGSHPLLADYTDSATRRQSKIPGTLTSHSAMLQRLDRNLEQRMSTPLDIASRLTVADAVAISGAAFAPLDARDSKTFGRYRVLLAMANLRLGVWLPNPYWVEAGVFPRTGWAHRIHAIDDWLDATSPYHVVQEAVGTPSVYSPHLYVTDGGHYDNLGLVEALRRRPAEIVVLDGSGDPEDSFPVMGNAMATARMDLGIEIDFRPGPMIRGTRRHPSQAWVTATATYPDKATCTIIYVKSVLPAGASWDLQSYQKQHPDFPATSQNHEVFDEFDFEAFRQLGYWVTGTAVGHP